jgi:hypothetical protein
MGELAEGAFEIAKSRFRKLYCFVVVMRAAIAKIFLLAAFPNSDVNV